MTDTIFKEALAWKRRGGVALDVGVSSSVWLGGMLGEERHEPFVYCGPADWEGEEELTYLPDEAALEAFIARLREAGRKAWG
jgi:hypothetical protein